MSTYRADSYFTALDEDESGGTYSSAQATAGPWDPGLQHGGPPGGLSVRVAERVAATATGREDLVAMRISLEFVGPVPVDDLTVTGRVVRAARSAALVETVLSSAGRDCLQARVWLVRDADTASVAHETVALPEPSSDLPTINAAFPYASSLEWRAEAGNIDVIGPGIVWGRSLTSLIEGEALTGLQRAVILGDAASGVSSALDWDVWSFVNVDLDVHLARPFQGEWLKMDARTQLGAHGSALCRSTLSDVAGELGCTAATLVLAPRR